jgi:hypothetical protein
MRRRGFITLLGGWAFGWPLATRAQLTPRQMSKVGWLKIQGPQHTPGQLRAFREGMQALGLIEGHDYVLEERYADDDETRLPRLAAELIASGVSVIVATSQPSIAAAWRVTKSVPVIGRMVDDPVTDGMAQSLARPDGDVTGVYTMTEEMNPKRLALLKEAAPSVRRVGVLLRRDFTLLVESLQRTNSGAIGGTADMPRNRRARRSDAIDPKQTIRELPVSRRAGVWPGPSSLHRARFREGPVAKPEHEGRHRAHADHA